MSQSTIDQLRERLATLQPLALHIIDDSQRHAGHAGAGGGGHYQLDIVATAFAGKNTVARHRMIYAAAGDLMKGRVHALSIRAKTPEEV
ncbi:MAG: BolA family transcriptional regulator [Rhodocyclales bacterium]|nr:BolA family transcriptional regulator [Rhodocyclales bacterium]